MFSSISGNVSGFVSNVKSYGSPLFKADFAQTENLFEFCASLLKLSGEISQKVLSQVEGYLLVMKTLEIPMNLSALFWTQAPKVSYFTLNMAALKDEVKKFSGEANATGIIDELLKVKSSKDPKVIKAYYQYQNEDHFRRSLANSLTLKQTGSLTSGEIEAELRTVDLKLIPTKEKLHLLSNETIHKLSVKCLALGSLLIPITWFASVGGFEPAIQGLAYLAGSLAKYQMLGVVGQAAASLPMIRIMETVLIGSYVAAFALRTWAAVRVYFATQAEDLQRSNARNLAIDNFIYGAFCFIRLTGGKENYVAPVATGVHLIHDLAAPITRDVKDKV